MIIRRIVTPDHRFQHTNKRVPAKDAEELTKKQLEEDITSDPKRNRTTNKKKANAEARSLNKKLAQQL